MAKDDRPTLHILAGPNSAGHGDADNRPERREHVVVMCAFDGAAVAAGGVVYDYADQEADKHKVAA